MSKEEKKQQVELRRRQTDELGKISDEENRRIKSMLLGGRYGTRGYRGAPMFRARPSNTSGGVALRTASSVGGASPAGAAMQAGGARGGLSRGGFRVAHQ